MKGVNFAAGLMPGRNGEMCIFHDVKGQDS